MGEKDAKAMELRDFRSATFDRRKQSSLSRTTPPFTEEQYQIPLSRRREKTAKMPGMLGKKFPTPIGASPSQSASSTVPAAPLRVHGGRGGAK